LFVCEVRVTKLLPPPVFYSTKYEESTCLEALANDLILHEAESNLSKPGNIELLVLQGKIKHYVSCFPDAMVLLLKHQLQQAIGVSLASQKLIFKGKQLKDDELVSTAGLKSGDKILLVISSEGLKELKTKTDRATRNVPLGFDVDTLLVGANPWSCSPGMCFLPKWVLDGLGIIDGEEVEVEPLQPPFNTRGHTIARALDDRDPKSAESLDRASCDLRVTDEWYCGQSKKNARGQEFVCCPPRPCQDCRQIVAPCLNGGLENAAKVLWRPVVEPVDGGSEFATFMKLGPKALLEKWNLQCIQVGMCVPLKWEPSQVDAQCIILLCEGIINNTGKMLSEAVFTMVTEHSFLQDHIDHEKLAHPTRSGADLWKKLVRAVKTSICFSSIGDDAFLMGEMVSDYLDQAASDEEDRNMIRSNEFGWLLKNDIAALVEEGTLPPRFEGIAGGTATSRKRHLSLSKDDIEPEKTEKMLKRCLSKPNLTDLESSKKNCSEKAMHSPEEIEVAPDEEFYSLLPQMVVVSDFEHIDADKDGFCTMEDLEVFLMRRNWRKEQIFRLFKAMDTNNDGKISREEFKTYAVGRRSSRRRLVRLWLKRKLYEEVQEQAFAFSRGLREIIPVGLLSLFSAPELQCLLGGGPAVDDLTLADWKNHCEYDLETRQNGLEKSHVRVNWFWEAVEAMSPSDRADVWRYATGKRQPPKRSEGGCGSLVPKFNLVAIDSRAEINDGALLKAATCYNQLQLPCYSSAQITAQQLRRSVQEGLASSEDANSFEEVRRRLLSHVQMMQVSSKGGMTQEILRSLFPNSYMCAKCNFGPVEHHHCADLRSHHGEEIGAGRISNACPKCGWFSAQVCYPLPLLSVPNYELIPQFLLCNIHLSCPPLISLNLLSDAPSPPQISDWPSWDGRVWPSS
jgi:hypothetical protein